jgi:hypothetical protein
VVATVAVYSSVLTRSVSQPNLFTSGDGPPPRAQEESHSIITISDCISTTIRDLVHTALPSRPQHLIGGQEATEERAAARGRAESAAPATARGSASPRETLAVVVVVVVVLVILLWTD